MKHQWILKEDGKPDEFAFESGFHNGVICRDCGKAVCVCCHPDYMEMDDCPGAPAPKTVTNADYIRAMSDEELAEFLDETQRMECEAPHIINDDGTLRFQSVKNGWRDWLQRPYEGD